MRMAKSGFGKCLTFALAALLLLPALLQARDLTLQKALDIAVNRTSRGGMIQGRLEVAQMNYDAKRINFYVPEISINGNLPTYAEDKSYRPYSGNYDKAVYQTKNLDFNSNIQLQQSLITGGVLTAKANLLAQDNSYPDTRFPKEYALFVSENSKRGYLDLSLDQPLFRPSQAKYDLHNRHDDLTIAQMTQREEESALKKEVAEAYLMMLRYAVQKQIYAAKFESARLQADIDSAKMSDGILSEDDFLTSVSNRLDAELAKSENDSQAEQQRGQLAMLLDIDPSETLELHEPAVQERLDTDVTDRLVASWEKSVPVRKAEKTYLKADRSADYAAAGHGITGDLQASYSLGRQKIEQDYDTTIAGTSSRSEDVSTSGWQVSLVFSLPVWDGGAGRAAVEAAHFEAEQARLEYESAKQEAKSSLRTLINQIDVNYRRLQIIAKQIELAQSKLDIAQDRYDNGEISMITFLESKVTYLETKDKYLEEMSSYLTNRFDLEGKFSANVLSGDDGA